MPFSLPQPSTLQDIFAMNPGAFQQAQDIMQGGIQQNQADLQKTQIANLFDEQNNPQLIQQQTLANQIAQARLPGYQADSEIRQNEAKASTSLYDDKVKAARDKFMSEASDSHIKELSNHAQEMAYSPDPAIRQQGEQLLIMSKEMVAERSKQSAEKDRQLSTMTLAGQNSKDIAKMNIDAGRWSPKGSGKTRDPVIAAELENDPLKKYTAYVTLSKEAELNGDDEAAQHFYQLAQVNKEAAQGKLAAAGAPVYNVSPTGFTSTSKGSNVQLSNTPPTNQFQRDLDNGAQFSSPQVEAAIRARASGGSIKPSAAPKTKEEYDALPSGTTYTAPDGSIKRKK